MGRGPASVSQADIARALRAIKQADVQMAVEITSDGAIRLIPVEAIPAIRSKAKRREPIPL